MKRKNGMGGQKHPTPSVVDPKYRIERPFSLRRSVSKRHTDQKPNILIGQKINILV